STADVVHDEVSVMEGLHVRSKFDEVEIELVEGDPRALREIERAVRRAGAKDADQRPKVFRAIGQTVHKTKPKRPQLQQFFERQRRLSADAAAAFALILVELERERAQSRRSLLNAMRTARYTRLLDRLEEAARRPRTRSARPSAEKIAAGQFGKLRKAVRALE